jgi:N-acetylneuraminate synthase
VSEPLFVIAECGVNHNGSLPMALELVDRAAAAGADAVKFQTFRPDALVSRAARKARYQLAAVGGTDTQLEMLESLVLTEADHHALRQRCDARSIEFMSTPFDEASCDLLERVGVARFKIGSGDLTHLPLVRHVASKGRPVILSTGMATLAEVEAAVDAVRAAGDPPLTLLHCVTEYPAPLDQLNLRAMETLRHAFGLPVGYSDHSLGPEASIAAVALGAVVVERHLTLDRGLPGPDHSASSEPEELRALIATLRQVQGALGDGVKRPAPCELGNREVARRSLVAARDLRAGERLAPGLVAIKRPATGIQPADLEQALGRRLAADVAADTPITWDMLA